jgi:hypothetical protein
VNDKKDRLRIPRTIGVTLGTALTAVLMVGVVTYGANVLRPLSAGTDADASASQPAAHKTAAPEAEPVVAGKPDTGDEGDFRQKEPTEEPKEEPKSDPTPSEKPSEKPAEPAPSDKPKEPAPTEKPKPVSDHLELDAWAKEGKVKLAWSKYGGDGFAYYKVVRSHDATVTWPLGENDVLVAAIADRFAPWSWDGAPCGTEFHYRVFAVKSSEAGYKVLAASNVRGAHVPCAEPTPDPVKLTLDRFQTDAGKVKLVWQQCSSEDFLYYKVVRSATNEAPSYPLHDGDQLLAAIGDHAVTSFVDGDVAAGQTWHYRVLCFGDGGTLLGVTNAVTITLE